MTQPEPPDIAKELAELKERVAALEGSLWMRTIILGAVAIGSGVLSTAIVMAYIQTRLG